METFLLLLFRSCWDAYLIHERGDSEFVHVAENSGDVVQEVPIDFLRVFLVLADVVVGYDLF